MNTKTEKKIKINNHRKRKLAGWFFIFSLFISSLALVGYQAVSAYPAFLGVEARIAKDKDIAPTEEIRINFSSPVQADLYLVSTKIRRSDSVFSSYEKIKVSFNENRTEMTIKPIDFWQPESDHMIFLPKGKNYLFIPIEGKTIKFSTESYPKVAKVMPEDGARDVLIDIEDPIVIDFDRSVKDYYVDFVITPFVEVAYQNNSEKTKFKILPKNRLQDGAVYSLKTLIKVKGASKDSYTEIYAGSFETLPPAPMAWEKDYNLRLAQARKFTRAKVTTGKYIDINLASQVMSIFEEGRLLDSYLISSGKRGMDTPKGEHKIYNKHPRTWSRQYGLYMPFWMAIAPSGKFGIHELPEWPGGYKEGASHLGIPVSHGCVRLGVGAAERVYNWADIGTPVVIY